MKGQAAMAQKPAAIQLTRGGTAVLQRQCACGQHTAAGECEECKEKKASLQRHAAGPVSGAFAPPIVHDVLRSSGQPLDRDTRASMEPRFHRDFSQVRVHSDERAAESARAVSAHAYTVGNDIVFAAGRYAPATRDGRRLLAHELTHVAQQGISGGDSVQYSLQIGPARDRFEAEADAVAERATSQTASPADTPAISPVSSVRPSVQRAEASAPPDRNTASARETGTLLVDDDAREVLPGQMRKREFLDKLKLDVCAAADQVLSSVGRTAQGCPYIEKWIGHFRARGSRQVERAIRKYAPESAGVTKAEDYIPYVAARVRRGVARWARTGEITEVPEELKGDLRAAALSAAVDRLVSGVGEAIGGAVAAVSGGIRAVASAVGGLLPKARDGGVRDCGNPQEIQAQLGSGHPLDGGTRSRMAKAFGEDFSDVHIHTDSKSAELTGRMNARAFTIGSDVAFGAGEYRPGTPIGDALIAHELAHVMQQRGERTVEAPLAKGAQYNTLEEDADASAVEAITSLWMGREGRLGKLRREALPRLKSGLRLQRCGGRERKLDVSTWTAKQRKEFIARSFEKKDQSVADKILADMLESSETKFFDEESLKDEIFKRLKTSQLMQETQKLYGVAFEYPEHGMHCIPNNKTKQKYPRVNKAAEAYWGPVQYESEGAYYFKLTEKGKNDAYSALKLLFTPQKNICNMTLIHCDYLASVVHFRAFAEEIGIQEFNRRVKNGDIEMRLAWNGFKDLEDVGWFHSKKSVSLREVRPANLKELVIGDHVIFFNHRAYDLINEGTHHEWRLENAILVYRRGSDDVFLGHGSGENTNHTMLQTLARKYNDVVKEAKDLTDATKSPNPKTAAAASQEMVTKFPKIKPVGGKWHIVGHSWGKDFNEELRPLNKENPEKETDLTGLHDPMDPTKMGCVKRPSEAPGESC
jgi:hypothetical protein